MDNFAGTAANDKFVADNSGTNKVLSAADSVKGGGGTDTLQVYNASADALETLSFAGVSGIANIYTNSGTLTDGKTTDATAISGLVNLEIATPVAIANGKGYTFKTSATQNLTLTKVNVAAAGAGTVSLDGVAKLALNATGTSTTDSGTLTLDVLGAATSLAVNTTTAASKVTLANTGAAMTALSVTGDQGLTLTTSLGLKTIDASAATGKIAVDVSGATIPALFAFTGGTGADTLTLKAGALDLLTAGSQLNGGSGNDTLVTKETAALTTAQLAAVNAAVSFEVLGFGASASGVDVSKLKTINSFKVLPGNFTESFTNSVGTTSYLIDNASGNSGTVTIGNKVGETATNITIDNGAGASKTLAKIDVTGISTVNLSSTGVTTKAGGASVLTAIVNSDNSNIVIKGDTDLTITSKLAATAVGSKVDASAFTGKLSVLGSDKGDTIIGGAGADTLNGGKGADTLTGGAGADTFSFTGTAGSADNGADGAAVAETITDFLVGTDKLQFTTVTDVVSVQQAAVQAAVTALAATATDAQIATAMANANTTDLGVSFAVFGGNTYVYYETTGATTTHVAADNTFIKLSGVTTAPTFAADVIA